MSRRHIEDAIMAATSETITGSDQRPAGGRTQQSDQQLLEQSTNAWAGERRAGRIDASQLNQALGWFSLGLGLIEIVAPRELGRLIGAGDHPTALRLCGLREIASGIGLLSRRAPAAAAASRLAGDVVDMALLGAAFTSRDAQPGRLGLAATTVLGVAAVDAYATRQHARGALAEADLEVPVDVSIAINSTPEKLYAFWRNPENLPRFMSHLETVRTTGERTSHWVAKAPAGSVEWESEIIDDRPNELIAWRTLPGSEITHRGVVSFEAAGNGRGCIVHVGMVYGAPGGTVGAGLAKLFGEEPELQIRRDLRALKQLLETGEVATTRGQPSGRRSLLGRTFTRREP
jgi:uncharacterized membrane protein